MKNYQDLLDVAEKLSSCREVLVKNCIDTEGLRRVVLEALHVSSLAFNEETKRLRYLAEGEVYTPLSEEENMNQIKSVFMEVAGLDEDGKLKRIDVPEADRLAERLQVPTTSEDYSLGVFNEDRNDDLWQNDRS